jgi:long-chain acyl-CoA synthetase
MGGRLRLVLSGGAPLSPDTHELIKICLCVKVIQGYGLTETCSSATVMDSKLNSHALYIIPDAVMIKKSITC